MSERPGNHQALAWTLTVFAVPVLYMLTLPPLIAITTPIGTPPLAYGSASPWQASYCSPAVWLLTHSPASVQAAYREYARWWLTGWVRMHLPAAP